MLVVIKGLQWNFGAEVLAILFVEVVMCAVGYIQNVKLWYAIIPIALYPASLLLVWALQKGGMN